MKKLTEMFTILILLLLALVLGGCGTFSTKPTIKISAVETNKSLSDIYPDAGLLYEFFAEYNAWTPAEEAQARGYYSDIIRAVQKIQRKTIAGQTDYHRLLYFTEDITEAWEGLRPMLDTQVAAMDTTTVSTVKYGIGLWRRVRNDVDAIIARNNINLAQAREDLNDATYDAIRDDAIEMIKKMTPLFEKGAAFLL